jgi:hypothetical protein
MNKRLYLAGGITLFLLFTSMLIAKDINQASYVALFSVLVLVFFVGVFKEQVKEIYLGKLVLKLYKKGEDGMAFSDFALAVVGILIKLDEHTSGSAKHRKEREAMIEKLMESLKTDRVVRKAALANAKLITKLMATEEGPELDKIRAEIDKRGLFD